MASYYISPATFNSMLAVMRDSVTQWRMLDNYDSSNNTQAAIDAATLARAAVTSTDFTIADGGNGSRMLLFAGSMTGTVEKNSSTENYHSVLMSGNTVVCATKEDFVGSLAAGQSVMAGNFAVRFYPPVVGV